MSTSEVQRRKVAGKPFKRGRMFWTRINGVRTPIGTDCPVKAQAFVDTKNSEGFLTKQLGVDERSVVKHSWKEACVRRAVDLDGLPALAGQLEYFAFWDKYLGHVTDLNKISREAVEQVILAERAGKLINGPRVEIEGKSVPLGVANLGLVPGVQCPGNTTANKYVKAVQTILNKAAGNNDGDWDWGVRKIALRKFPEPEGRDLMCDAKTVWAMASSLPAHSRDMVIYAIATMQRRGTVTKLKWEWIDFATATLTIPPEFVKNRKKLQVPLNRTAMAVILRRAIATDRHPVYVFHFRGRAPLKQVVTKRWRDGREEAGIEENVVMHTMRHSSSSWLYERGISEAIVARIGGWTMPKKLGAMGRYLKARVDKLRQFVAYIDEDMEQGFALWQQEKDHVTQLGRNDTVLSQSAFPALRLAA